MLKPNQPGGSSNVNWTVTAGNTQFSETSDDSSSEAISFRADASSTTVPPVPLASVAARRHYPNTVELDAIAKIRTAASAATGEKLCPTDFDISGDYKVGRFLIAADNDVDLATKMFTKYLSYRSEADREVDRIRRQVLEMTPDVFTEWWNERCHPWFSIHPYCGETRQGDILVWIRAGGIDATRIVEDRPKDLDFHQVERRMMMTLMEWLNYQVDLRTRSSGHYTYCVKLFDFNRPTDWKKITPKPQFPLYSMPFLSLFQSMAEHAAIMYPEMDAAIIVTNPSTSFKRFWFMGSQFAAPRTLSKLTICSNVAADGEGRERLLSMIPEELLPKQWGGTGVHHSVRMDYATTHGKRLLILDDYLARRSSLETELPSLGKAVRRRSHHTKHGHNPSARRRRKKHITASSDDPDLHIPSSPNNPKVGRRNHRNIREIEFQ